MPTNSKHWTQIRATLRLNKATTITVSVLASVVLPIIESVLVNLWTSAQPGKEASTTLAVLLLVGALHLLLAFALILQQALSDSSTIAHVIELEAVTAQQQAELDRRNASYRILCETLSHLNQQTCHLASDAPHICTSPFETRLREMLDPILSSPDTVFGVKGNIFTIELYLHNWQLAIGGKPKQPTGYAIDFFYSPSIPSSAPLELAECTIAPMAFQWNIPNEQGVRQNSRLFLAADGKRKQHVYFERYAVCPVSQACSPDTIGVLILTSAQTEAFAPDVCESLALVASLISRYLYDYRSCICQQYGSWYRHEVLVARMFKEMKQPFDFGPAENRVRIINGHVSILASPLPQNPRVSAQNPTRRLQQLARTTQGEAFVEALRTNTIDRLPAGTVDTIAKYLCGHSTEAFVPIPQSPGIAEMAI